MPIIKHRIIGINHMTKIAINGFGRIGRLTLRRILNNHPDLEVVAINDLMPAETAQYLLKFDSAYGRFNKEVSLKKGTKGAVGKLAIGNQDILVFNESDPINLPWEELGVEIVIESTGKLSARKDLAKHLEAGAKRVVISANCKEADLPIVFGVNHEEYSPKKHQIISNCSCTTNCAVPVINILDKNWGIDKAQLTTVHAITASQSSVDGAKKDIKDGRAGFSNIIPSETGAAKAVAWILPWLKDRISGLAYRVPVLTGSVLEIIAQTKQETSAPEINEAFKKAAKGELNGVLAVSDENMVSSDIIGTDFAAIVDLGLTEVMNLPKVKDQNLVKVVAWYDNEWGYCCQLARLVEYIGKKK
ncbi:MAG: type I glyceraldehyde-3-phosphate dehydrogenase [bacterium]|nr:type I glyceraldehyde-3-phosphate dehydrogenase [bacterium]